MKSVTKLNNNRSAGYDNISAESIEYWPDALPNSLPTIMNEALEKHTAIETEDGILVALPKPGKVNGPFKNLRPVIRCP